MKRLLLTLLFALLGTSLAQSLTVWTHFQNESLAWLEQEAATFQGAFGVEVDLVYVPVNENRPEHALKRPRGARSRPCRDHSARPTRTVGAGRRTRRHG